MPENHPVVGVIDLDHPPAAPYLSKDRAATEMSPIDFSPVDPYMTDEEVDSTIVSTTLRADTDQLRRDLSHELAQFLQRPTVRQSSSEADHTDRVATG